MPTDENPHTTTASSTPSRTDNCLTDRDRTWLDHHRQWQQSGLTLRSYTRESGVNYHAMSSGLERLRTKGVLPRVRRQGASSKRAHPAPRPDTSAFMPVKLQNAHVDTTHTVRRLGLANGHWLELEEPVGLLEALRLLAAQS